MANAQNQQPEPAETCACFHTPYQSLSWIKELGMDAHFAEVSILACSVCGQNGLRFFYELEAFTASGRWYLGAIDPQQAANLTVENAQKILENLGWYFYGGSYFGGKIRKGSGMMHLGW
jgi:hypothetical protein